MDDSSTDAKLSTEQRIRAKAYMIWEKEGRPDGRAWAHWFKACELVEQEERDTEKTGNTSG
jgi:hypothetical protein